MRVNYPNPLKILVQPKRYHYHQHTCYYQHLKHSACCIEHTVINLYLTALILACKTLPVTRVFHQPGGLSQQIYLIIMMTITISNSVCKQL